MMLAQSKFNLHVVLSQLNWTYTEQTKAEAQVQECLIVILSNIRGAKKRQDHEAKKHNVISPKHIGNIKSHTTIIFF